MNASLRLSFYLFFSLTLFLPGMMRAQCGSPAQVVSQNGGFENGDLSGWMVSDCAPLSNFMSPRATDLSGYSTGFGFQPFGPSEGSYQCVLGLDGDGPCQVSLCQDFTIPDTVACAELHWQEILEWAYFFTPGTEKTYAVQVIDTTTSQPLETLHQITLDGSHTLPTPGSSLSPDGWQPVSADLINYLGQSVRICFTAEVPEAFAGPALLHLDEVQLVTSQNINPPPPAAIPTLSQWGLFLFGLCLFTLSVVILYNLYRLPQRAQ